MEKIELVDKTLNVIQITRTLVNQVRADDLYRRKLQLQKDLADGSTRIQKQIDEIDSTLKTVSLDTEVPDVIKNPPSLTSPVLNR